MSVRSAPENGDDGGIRDTHHLRQPGQNYVMLREILEELVLRHFHLFVCHILAVAIDYDAKVICFYHTAKQIGKNFSITPIF